MHSWLQADESPFCNNFDASHAMFVSDDKFNLFNAVSLTETTSNTFKLTDVPVSSVVLNLLVVLVKIMTKCKLWIDVVLKSKVSQVLRTASIFQATSSQGQQDLESSREQL